MIYDREKKEYIQDKQFAGELLQFLYQTVVGRFLLKIASSKIFSNLAGIYYNSIFSKKKIRKFIKKYSIDLREYEKKQYKSFNDFFTRKKVYIEHNYDKNDFISPADSKLTVYKIDDDLTLKIKNSTYNIKDFLINKEDCFKYRNGLCFVFRLSMDDYHRYCFPDSGELKESRFYKGVLHTVSSVSEKYKVFSKNSRNISMITTDNFSDISYVEIGAMLVGKIKNNDVKEFKKGEEKGYFELGGSTIVLITKDVVRVDNDIMENSLRGIETKIKYAERIGEKND